LLDRECCRGRLDVGAAFLRRNIDSVGLTNELFPSLEGVLVTRAREEAQQLFTGVIAMSPMATGGNLPYRRLCREYGAALTCSEMVVASKLVKGERSELPLLRCHPSETSFGVQLCGNSPEVLAEAARMVTDRGSRFVDLNFGCPIEMIVRRGGGAALLKRPSRLGTIVAGVRQATDLPLSVKIRLGWSEKRINAVKIARICEEAGADAVGVHGRTREQHYKRNADWNMIDMVAKALHIPVLGNGDILTPWDLELRRSTTSVSSFLIARGALIKPWIFGELAKGEPIQITPAKRWAVMRRYYEYAAEYFGDDEKGLGRIKRFFLWHLGFWFRYRPYTEEDFRCAQPASLIQMRDEPVVEGEPDEILLASTLETDHELIWERVRNRDFPGG